MRKIIFFCFLLCSSIQLPAQSILKKGTDKIKLFDEYIQSSMSLWKTTGLAVAVMKDGDVIFKKGYGVTDIRTGQSFSTSTISFCASTTKAMTVACIGMLVDEGKLNWDDKLKTILPNFRLYDAYVSDEITVRDLLRHNAGLGNGDLLWLFGYSSGEIMRRMQFMKPAYSMRSSFIYQNLMYVVAGEVIKKVSGMPWHQFISKRIFQPLGMAHTYTLFKDAAAEPSRITPHYMYGDSVIKPIEAIDFGGYDPAGSVVSCIDDMTNWMKFLQDSGRWNGMQLIKPGTFAEFFKPQAIIPPAEFYPTAAKTHPHWTTYGLGWFQQDYRGKMIQFHTGSLDGAIAIFCFIPEEKLSFYFYANIDHNEIRHALMWKFVDLWSFNDNSRDWSTELYFHYKSLHDAVKNSEQEMAAKRVLNTKPGLALEGYCGKYSNEIYGDAEITMDNNQLLVKFPNKISLRLQHWNFDTFIGLYNYSWYEKSWINFRLNNTGKVESFDFEGIEYNIKE